MTSNRKSASVNRCVFPRRTVLPNFTPIRFEMTERQALAKRSPQQEQEEDQEKE